MQSLKTIELTDFWRRERRGEVATIEVTRSVAPRLKDLAG